MGAYHLSEKTGWEEHCIMVRVFPKSTNQPNEMALTNCNLISIIILFSADERLETGKLSIPNGKRGVPLKVLHNF